ncbi:malate:quinone oxidoreductase [Aquimarina muelleri]|uniref:malate dehydrogenase (quinone) n=1 Tax=Aquimarina muelleri TaxID=279356 RepID=A0A918N2S6_9FLAO|nr:hypothetical protein GCM10007384_03590 [Aquimarina muelleri]
MSATLALRIKLLKPETNILILERLDQLAKGISAAWNNAGTGHSALCELNCCLEDRSTAPSIMLQVLEKAFPEILESADGAKKIKKFIPMYNTKITSGLFQEYLKNTKEILKL